MRGFNKKVEETPHSPSLLLHSEVDNEYGDEYSEDEEDSDDYAI